MFVLKSPCNAFQRVLREVFPSSQVDLRYDPVKPTIDEVAIHGYSIAEGLRKRHFRQRAEEMVKEGWPAAAAYYGYCLVFMDGLQAKRWW